MSSLASLKRSVAHAVFGSRKWMNRQVSGFAGSVRGKRILELGSGRQDLGAEAYSVRRYFDPSNDFVQSDVVPEHGHLVVDATTMEFENEFDIILCLNVLEHIFDFKTAIERIHRGLKRGGTGVFVVPVFFPWHDEPYDFWRFTEHSLRVVLDVFDDVTIRHRGMRQLPFSYFVTARKGL
jgi:SAM-dependent methyltransferase